MEEGREGPSVGWRVQAAMQDATQHLMPRWLKELAEAEAAGITFNCLVETVTASKSSTKSIVATEQDELIDPTPPSSSPLPSTRTSWPNSVRTPTT